MTRPRDEQLRLLYEASRSVQSARDVSIRLGSREHADRCFKLGLDIMDLIGEIATEAPRVERTVS